MAIKLTAEPIQMNIQGYRYVVWTCCALASGLASTEVACAQWNKMKMRFRPARRDHHTKSLGTAEVDEGRTWGGTKIDACNWFRLHRQARFSIHDRSRRFEVPEKAATCS